MFILSDVSSYDLQGSIVEAEGGDPFLTQNIRVEDSGAHDCYLAVTETNASLPVSIDTPVIKLGNLFPDTALVDHFESLPKCV